MGRKSELAPISPSCWWLMYRLYGDPSQIHSANHAETTNKPIDHKKALRSDDKNGVPTVARWTGGLLSDSIALRALRINGFNSGKRNFLELRCGLLGQCFAPRQGFSF